MPRTNHIVKDSINGMLVQTAEVPENTKAGDIVLSGAKKGIAGYDAVKGSDGKWYVNVDTGALLRLEGVAIALTDGQPVYLTPTKQLSTSSTSPNVLFGHAYRAKGATAGNAWIQLVPNLAA